MITLTNLKQLYEIDDSQWLEETIKLLKSQQFKEIDWENLIEELEDLGKEKKNAVVRLLEQMIRHLLLLEYWHSEREYNQVHWQEEVYNFGIQLKRRLTTNLRNYLESELNSIYQDALGFVQIKTQKTVKFPPDCPYSLDQLLSIDWLPN